MRLTNREIRVLSLLGEGRTYRSARNALGMTIQNMHSTCHYIRKKTGIQQTRDPEECRRYLSKLPESTLSRALGEHRDGWKHTRGEQPTGNQIEVLRLIALGRTYKQIATFFGTTAQSAQNLASRACKRVGIIHAGWNRTKRIKEWAQREYPPEADPMDDPMF